MRDRPTVVIADDHPLFRSGLKQLIENECGFDLKYDATDGEEALGVICREVPDIAILDIDMPEVTGLEVARVIRNRGLATEIIFLTMYKEEDVFNKAMETGARGYVLKESAAIEIVSAIRTVAQGKYYVSPSISEYLVRRAGYPATSSKRCSVVGLTPAERRVLALIAEHRTNNEIADELKISPKTVARHRENVANKLNIHGSHMLLKFALENKENL